MTATRRLNRDSSGDSRVGFGDDFDDGALDNLEQLVGIDAVGGFVARLGFVENTQADTPGCRLG